MDTVCWACDYKIPRGEFTSHMENVHIGLRAPESTIFVTCGTCRFRSTIDRVDLIIIHCSATGHDTGSVRSSWVSYGQREDERIRKLVQQGVRFADRLSAEEHLREEEMSIIRPQVMRPLSPRDESVCESLINSRTEYQPSNFGALVHLKTETNDSIVLEPTMKKNGISAKLKERSDREEDAVENTPKMKTEREKKRQLEGGEWTPPKRRPAKKKRTNTKMETNEACTPTQCALCPYKIIRKTRLKQYAVEHIFSHDPSLRPLKCSHCDFTSTGPNHVRAHANRVSRGCDGSFMNIQTGENIANTRLLLQKAFPSVNWDEKLPAGKIIYCIQF